LPPPKALSEDQDDGILFGLKHKALNKPPSRCAIRLARAIQAGWLDKGSFASLVDFDSYWHPDAMREASKFCTDDVAQLLHYKEAGYFQDIPPIHAELGELVTGRKAGREDPEEKTMAANLGLAIDDMAVGHKIYERALQLGIGTRLPL
jgi:ornithine cyclodeaminase/alanine dehydrogenase-like protein (mu-crystallin family)